MEDHASVTDDPGAIADFPGFPDSDDTAAGLGEQFDNGYAHCFKSRG